MGHNSSGRARDIIGAGARGCSIMGSSEEFFFFIVLVVFSDTYRSFGIPSEYLFQVRKIFPLRAVLRGNTSSFDGEDD